MSDREKAIEKIRKCLALGKSPNEHEAAAALRQAQALMKKFALTEDDVEGAEYATATIVSDYEFGKKKPLIIVAVANLIQHAMGVECTMGGVRKGASLMHTVTYIGPRSRIFAAEFAHTVVYRACGAAWREFVKNNPHVKSQQGARAGFYAGWCHAVRKKVEALIPSEKEREGIKRAMDRHAPDRTKAEVGSKEVSQSTMRAGYDAARDFNLHQPLAQDRLKIGVDK